MTGTIPGRPSLAHLKKQAKQLLSAFRAGDPEARDRFSTHLPGYREGNPLALHDAQSAIAREHGFPSWQKLADEVRMRVRLPHGEPERVILLASAGGSVRPADRHVNCVRFAPTGGTLLSAGMDGRIREWEPASGAELRAVQAHPRSANTLSFHPDETLLASGSSDGVGRVFRWPSLDTAAETRPKVGTSCRFSPLGDRLLTVGLDGRARLWSWPGLDLVADLRVHGEKVAAACFTPDGEALLTGALDGSVACTRLSDGEPTLLRPTGGPLVCSMAFVPGAARLIAVEYGVGLALFSWPALAEVARSGPGAAGVFATDVHPSEEVFAMTVERGVQLRRADTLELLGTLPIPAKGVYTVSFSRDDRWLAAGGADQRIRIWRVADG